MDILIVTHGNLGDGLLESYNMIAGESENINVVKLTDSGVEEFRQKINNKLDELTFKKNKVLVLCDIKGGTPYNESFMYSLENPDLIEIVTGVNLPMLIEIGFLSQSNNNVDVENLSDTAVTTGKESIEKLIETNNDTLDL